MSQTLQLMAHELRLMWKEFRFSAKRRLTILLIVQVTLMVILVHIGLALFMFVVFEAVPQVGEGLIESLINSGLTSSRIFDILFLILLMFFVSSFVKGLISSGFGWLFTRVDENIIYSSPAAPGAMYTAKRFKRLLIHVLMVTMVLLALFPLITRIGFQGFRILVLFAALLAFLEIYGLVENVSYCMSRALTNRRSRFRTVIVALGFGSVSIFVIAPPFLVFFGGNSFAPLTSLYPPYIFSSIVTFGTSVNIVFETFILIIEAILFFLCAFATARFGLRRWASSPRFVQTRGTYIGLKKNRLTWKSKKRHDARLIFMKDFWTTIRSPSKLLVPLGVALILFIFLFQLQMTFTLPTQQMLPAAFTQPAALLSIYLATIFILPPAWDSFAGERRTLFILKSSPISPSSVVTGKYLFALAKSALYTGPIVGMVSVVFPVISNVFLYIALEVFLVLLISNAVGILASVSYPPAYRGIGPPPLLIVVGLPLLCAVLTVIIPILIMMSITIAATLSSLNIMSLLTIILFVLIYAFAIVRICLRRAVVSLIELQESQ